MAFDDKTVDSLRAALAASPDNQALLVLLLRAHLERGEPERGHALLVESGPLLEAEADRRLAAEVCLAAGDAARGLELAEGPAPETRLVRARLLLALERTADGLEAYRGAVQANPTLEDPALETLLRASVAALPQRGGEERPRLRVISNDDTDSSEISRLLEPASEPVTFAEVGGLDEVKSQIRKRILLPFQKPSLFERFKRRVGGGILMYGPPGCGKTLLARATAGECRATFYNVAISDVLDMYIGESERKLHALFEQARRTLPAVLFFDELEALGGKRQYTRESTSSKLVSQFLSEMDGFAQKNGGVLILGATNVPWAIDPAFRRPGRFDRTIFVPPPDRPAREAIFGILLEGRPVAGDVDARHLAERSSGLSGADLKNVVDSGIDLAIEESLESGQEAPLRQEHLRRALKEVKSTTLEWLTTARNYARYANEAGQYDEVLDFLKRHAKD